MIMPFIRLVAIYIVVIVAVVAFFKRDQLMELTGWNFGASQPAQAVTKEAKLQAPVEPLDPVVETEPTPQPVKAEPASDTLAEAPIVQPAPDPAPETQPAQTRPATPVSERLTEARKAYWQGDLTRSEALYVALAQEAPENPDVNGELGNIYFAQARFDKAADAYFATGKLLVENGNPQQVGQLIGVLQSIAPQKAATLREMVAN